MRIISGNYRGKKLINIESDDTRPTTDRVKENIFNLIMFDIKDSLVLDLFAGSGALGIECISRGAKTVDFNDNNAKTIEVIKQNLKNIKGDYTINCCDYFELLNKLQNKQFDLIFLDPPYKFNIENELLKIFVDNNIIKLGGKIVYETDRELNINNDNYELVKQKKYGITYVSIYRRIY